jgi:hypothetical protein
MIPPPNMFLYKTMMSKLARIAARFRRSISTAIRRRGASPGNHKYGKPIRVEEEMLDLTRGRQQDLPGTASHVVCHAPSSRARRMPCVVSVLRHLTNLVRAGWK